MAEQPSFSDPFPEDPPAVQPNSWLRGFLVESLQTILLALALFAAINFFTARIRVEGHSMEPNYHHNNYVIVARWAYWLGDIQRGDVVVFPYPNNPEEDYIKRVIGLPGDRVAVRGGLLLVNDQIAVEDYLAEPMAREFPEVTVPEGHIFVMGDNRNDSSDSRRWGALSMEAILGKAVLVYWPFADFHFIQSQPPLLITP